MSDRTLGELEQIVLLAILRLGQEAYGVPIVDEIERRTGRAPSRAAVYIVLTRLEKKGLVSSRLGEPTRERGGKARRFFRLLPAGLERLRETKAVLNRMWEGLELVGDRTTK